eukprot:scaffold3664_cov407-Prasinococcus_capsulatus_cf.AAC.12
MGLRKFFPIAWRRLANGRLAVGPLGHILAVGSHCRRNRGMESDGHSLKRRPRCPPRGRPRGGPGRGPPAHKWLENGPPRADLRPSGPPRAAV